MTDERNMFDAVAAEYHAWRPAYPDALFADLTAAAGGVGGRVLEVGCGTGQATRGLVDNGWEVVALDPGAALIRLAQASMGDRATFHITPFEQFDPAPASFRLVASAQAWHWIDPAIGFVKAAQALEPGGSLAVFGHVPMPPAPAVLALAEPIYAELAPELWGHLPEAWYLPQGPVRALFDASRQFGPVTHRAYAWTEQVTSHAFVRQLRTRSYYNALGPDRCDRLLARLETALAPLGEITLPNETHLYHAEVRA